MKSLAIKTNNSHLLDYLLNELRNLEIKNVCFSLREFKHYKNIIIHYTGKDSSNFYSIISTLLTFLIIDELEEDFLKKVIIHNYFYFDANERKGILNLCYDLLSEDFPELFNKKFTSIYNSFFMYISSHKSIVLKGFINFRMKSYWEVLSEIVNESVNTFIIEKEYLEFISLLKLYIESQEPLSDVVHLIYTSSDSFLLDKNKNRIEDDNNILNAKYLSDISFSSNDYTLNSLLSLLPKKIYIHLVDNCTDEFIKTLQTIFENRIIFCNDYECCEICKSYKKHKRFLFKK